MKRICVVGLGYIGLPTALMLALNGFQVVGVDINEELVKKLNRGEISIKEPFLGRMLNLTLKKRRLFFKTKPEDADVYIIAVPTPIKKDKTCDLGYITSAVHSIVSYIKKETVVIIESTIPPGITDSIIKDIIEQSGLKVGDDIYLAYCPERVLPGDIIKEMVQNSRIVGGCTPQCTKNAAEVYKSFVEGEILLTDTKTAEMSKLMENTFRDVNIALVNELTKICNKLQINVLEVIKMANKHPRVNLHQPGPGVGGHCLAVDPYFIIDKAPQLANIISMSRETNNGMPNYVVLKVKQLTQGVQNPKIAIFGITYKGNVDDIRESAALKVVNLLRKEGVEIAIYDPYIKTTDNSKLELTGINEAVKDADMVLILVDHNEFKDLDFKEMSKKMKTPLIFDTKNIIIINEYNSEEVVIKNFGNIFDD